MRGPPTWPEIPSSDLARVAGADVSVYPKPSLKGQEKTIFKNAITLPSIGADPVTNNLTLPPRRFLSFLKIIAS